MRKGNEFRPYHSVCRSNCETNLMRCVWLQQNQLASLTRCVCEIFQTHTTIVCVTGCYWQIQLPIFTFSKLFPSLVLKQIEDNSMRESLGHIRCIFRYVGHCFTRLSCVHTGEVCAQCFLSVRLCRYGWQFWKDVFDFYFYFPRAKQVFLLSKTNQTVTESESRRKP